MLRELLVGAALVLSGFAATAAAQDGGPVEDVTEDEFADEPLLLPNQGPEAPPGDLATIESSSAHVAKRHPVDNELRVFTAGTWHETMEVPDVDFDRVYLEYTSWPNHPNGDPWDRTFSVGVNGTELVHGTTTRGNFTIYEDVTEYAERLEPNTTVPVDWYLDTWSDNGIVTNVTFHFLNGDASASTPAGPHASAEEVHSPFYTHRLHGAGDSVSGDVSFPDEAPTSATLEVFTSGHGGDGEFWYLNAASNPTPPTFHVEVDGEPVGRLEAVPYVYALLGFDGGEEANAINQYAWWSGHMALDRAGVHHGVGEVPSYRASVAAEDLDLLTGDRTITVTQVDHGGTWITSLNVLLEPSEGVSGEVSVEG